jgi:hypothetical protein
MVADSGLWCHLGDKQTKILAELVQTCEKETLPLLVREDFNIIRRQEEKNKNYFNPRWPFILNVIIESLELREIAMSGRQFNWVCM